MTIYFATTLPMLLFESAPPMSLEAFRESARSALSPVQVAVLSALADGTPCAHPFVTTWRTFDTQLHNVVARARAAKLHADAAPYLQPCPELDISVERAIASAFQETNPLRREDALERIRFDKVHELVKFAPLTFDAILAYYLQLSIIHHRAKRNADQGRARRDGVIDALLQQNDI